MTPTDGDRARTFESVLASRRMCRDFDPRPLDGSLLDPVLAAATRAPAAGNTAAIALLVLRGGDVPRYWDVTLSEQRRATFPWPGLLSAPVLVVPYVEPGRYVERYAEPDKVRSGLGEGESAWSVPYWWVDGGAAVMALLLAAEAAGLGALLFGQFEHEPAVRREFGVPESQRALGTVALGHPTLGGSRPSRSAARGRPSLDVVRHDRVFDRSRLAPDESVSSLWRWTLDLRTGRAHEQQLDDAGIEFPRVDERLVGRRQRYGWAVSTVERAAKDRERITFDGASLYRRDFDTGEVLRHEFGPGRAAGEAVFVPSGPDAAEDDGHLLTLVYDATTDRSELVVLPAQDVTADPVAVVHLPQRVPFGFHGNWLPS